MRALTTSMIILGACATVPAPAPQGGPRGLRASEHLDLARHYDDQAEQESRWPEDPSRGTGRWVRSWDTVAEHERLAAIHRSRAAQLGAAYDEACGDRPVSAIRVSPIQRFGMGGANTSTGVLVFLDAKAGAPDELLADLRCHRAWMMLAPADMDDCPLDMPGLFIEARGEPEGITLSFVVRDPRLVPEVQRRAAHDLHRHP